MRKVLVAAAILLMIGGLGWYCLYDFAQQKPQIGHQDEAEKIEQGVAVISGDVAPALPEAKPSENPETLTEEPAAQIPDGWQLAWADEFDTLDIEYWTRVDRRDNYNRELQYYVPGNAFVRDGFLVLQARSEILDGKKYTSGLVDTYGKFEMLKGRIEARISLPAGKGLLPAFWLLTEDGSHEIDVVEWVGKEPNTIYGVNHYSTTRGSSKTYGYTDIDHADAFHIYALEWDENELRWYLDGELYHSAKKGVPDKPMYLLFSLAVGGVWPGKPDENTVFPCEMLVDYVRVYITQDGEDE